MIDTLAFYHKDDCLKKITKCFHWFFLQINSACVYLYRNRILVVSKPDIIILALLHKSLKSRWLRFGIQLNIVLVQNNITKSQTNSNTQKLKVMKKQSTTLLAQLDRAAVTNLTNIVNETLAMDLQVAAPKKVFTAAELWNIQRQKKSMVQRRYNF